MNLEQAFEMIINSFLENGVGICDDFLNKDLSNSLKANLRSLYEEKLMVAAGIGNDLNFVKDQLVRNDVIYWLDRKHNNSHENSFLDLIDAFVEYLNRTCFTGIVGYEFHYTMYEVGSYYKRHLDQFKNNQKRAFSFITYLNEDWVPADGGELCIYHDYYSQFIPPVDGKSVFFRSSDLEHEVMINNKPRMSITGWLKTSL